MLLEDGRPIYLTAMGELEPGSVFAGHRIDAVAGRGGMGVVYRATQLALDRTVALKVIAPGLLEDQTVRARFVRESKVAASIDHPNVIPIYYAGDEGGIAYIAMRYVAGDDVRSLVRREGRLEPARAARIVAQIGAALDEAHAAGLVHRDIKPANVLLTAEDHVYLTDFGLTKHALSVAGSTKPGHWVGTLDYVAPEQIRGERVDARVDVYALGCLLYFCLTGEVPFKREGDEARLWAHLSEPPPKPSELVPDLPDAFDFVIERALAKDPDERYPSAGDLGRAALAAAAGRTPSERERLVATGAAAPVESPTVTAAVKTVVSLPKEAETQLQPEAETVRQAPERKRRPLALAALAVVIAAGIIAAIALGGDDTPAPRDAATPSATATAKAKPTATATATAPTIAEQITVGNRPNVVRVAGGNVFVGSFRNDHMRLVSTKTAQGPRVRAARRPRRQRRGGQRQRHLARRLARPAAGASRCPHRPAGRPPDQDAEPAERGRGHRQHHLGRAVPRRRPAGPARQDRSQEREHAPHGRLPVRDQRADHEPDRPLGRCPPPRAHPARGPEDGTARQDHPRRAKPDQGHRLQERRALARHPGRRHRLQADHRVRRQDPDQRGQPTESAGRDRRQGLRHQLRLEQPLRDRRKGVHASSATH